MYIEHPYQYGGKYYAKVDGKFIEITKEVAYAMNNFYRSSMPKTLAIKNEKGEVIGKILREIPYSAAAGEDDKFMIEDFPDRHCNVEETVLNQVEGREMDRETYKQTADKISSQLEEIRKKMAEAESKAKMPVPVDDGTEVLLDDFLKMERFDAEKLRKIIKVIRVHSQEEIEIEWNFDDVFSEKR